MTDWANEPSPARQLRAWTRLDPDTFGAAYQNARIALARHWNLLTREADPVLAGCEFAEAHSQISDLAERVAEIERFRGRSGGEIDQMLVKLGNPAIAQALINAGLGLPDESMHLAIGAAMRASVLIKENGVAVGTGFLVRSDLVLTAAHVVLATVSAPPAAPTFGRSLRPGLSFFCRSPQSGYDREVPPASPASDPVICAEPFADPPNRLRAVLDGSAIVALDFALIRLAHQVSDLPYLDIREPPPTPQGALWVVGFPGGNAITFPSHQIVLVDNASGRVFHSTNALPGMSGSCCLGLSGKVVALHEGAQPKLDQFGNAMLQAGAPMMVNRAVSLNAIRARLRAASPDPLDERARAPGFAIFDRNVVERWLSELERLAGPDLARWRRELALKLGWPRGDGALPAFHPWFARAKLERWIDDAPGEPVQRVRYVNGAAGAGKSFAVQILRAKLREPDRDLVAFDALGSDIASLMRALLPPNERVGETPLRTVAGELAYDRIPLMIEQLGRAHGAPRTAEQPLFVAVDFGRGDVLAPRSRFANTPLEGLLLALARQRWARLLLIGLTRTERRDLDTAFENDPLAREVRSANIVIEPIGLEAITDFAHTALTSAGVVVERDELDELLEPWEEPRIHTARPELQTAEAVLFTMKCVEQLWMPQLAAKVA